LKADDLKLVLMSLKHFVAKITSVLLIFSTFYQTVLSINAILFVYPQLANLQRYQSLTVEKVLVEKAIIIYVSMLVSGTYGITLLVKPAQQLKIAHILVGILIFIGSLFFISQDPIMTDPIQQLILRLLQSRQ
jgi:hypothetical protein